MHGFLAGLSNMPTFSFICKNLQSAIKDPQAVDDLMDKELEKGYMIGPFDQPPFKLFRINPLGVAVRKYPGKKRLIIDLSAPHSTVGVPSINSLIPSEPFSLTYSTVDNAIKLIKLAGRGAWLSKADITDAFKIMPLHPSQWHLFGVRWREKIYFSVRLTFGCESSPKIFDTLSEALCCILLNNFKLPFVLHLLDDFLLIDFPDANPLRSINSLVKAFNKFGIPLAEEKTKGPFHVLDFVGITLDSVKMQASLPLDKLERIRGFIRTYSCSPTLTKRYLLSLLGHLNFAMRIIPQGRSFISRLLDLSKTVESMHATVTLDEGCRSDLKFWSKLCNNWNGISFFYDDEIESSVKLQFFTDAAPSVGFGGIFNNQWFAERWPKELKELAPSIQSTALLEIYPIVIACLLWADQWSRKSILVFCDNEAAVNIINKGRSSVPFINRFIRRLTWISIMNNFTIKAAHIPGLDNKIADSLSWFNFQEFRRLCPGASPSRLGCPNFSQTILG
ncbi:uncharacterized protein LOC127946375 [Carassius gibelio]|uniref:uncharacterized protein LOC127946375 n=1 Tax=Carassius gibelio TaxID=101364 RepID=UPI002278A221|nr:uncharacterized protein LOC127946375 [Carassius gibelio]